MPQEENGIGDKDEGKDSSNRFLLLYGSQTGQAESIANEISEKAPDHDLKAALHCLDKTEKRFWLEKETCVVFVTSTTGDGEPPDNACKFFRRIKKKTLPTDYLKHLHFAILGLGDSNYSNFCNFAKSLEKRLLELEAKKFYLSGWADDAIGLELVVEGWIEQLWPALQSHLSGNSDKLTPSDSYISVSDNIRMTHQMLINGEKTDNTDISKVMSDYIRAANTSSKLPIEDGISKISLEDYQINNNQNTVNNDKIPNGLAFSKDSENFSENQPISPQGLTSLNKSNNSSWSFEPNDFCFKNSSAIKVLKPVQTKEIFRARVITELSDCPFTVPSLVIPYLELNSSEVSPNFSFADVDPFPSSKSSVVFLPVRDFTRLTSEDSVKSTYQLRFDSSGCNWKYLPGDCVGVVCPNPSEEVDWLINRLNLAETSDAPYTLQIIAGTKRRNPTLKKYIPDVFTIRHLLTHCLDIRSIPKKSFLRSLAEACVEDQEKQLLLRLCSKEGANLYSSFVHEQALCLIDILVLCPSCTPTITCIIEHLPRLFPRPYSIASFQTESLDIVFNLVEIPMSGERSFPRKGLCTSWLTDLCCQIKSVNNEENVQSKSTDLLIPVFLRSNQRFHPHEDLAIPLILIGPGTGIAPFISFLQHREQNLLGEKSDKVCWLFYGCRNEEKDFLFRDQLENFLLNNTLSRLSVAYSRDPKHSKCYVQDKISEHGAEIASLICDKNASIFVCGDAKNMAKDVASAISQVLKTHTDYTLDESQEYLTKMRINHRYLEDIWI